MTKAPTPTETSKGKNDNTNNATKKVITKLLTDYRAVADRLRRVSWSNYGHPTGVINLVYGPNLPTPCKPFCYQSFSLYRKSVRQLALRFYAFE